jgi:polyhydroxybutyrate depolymerase
VHLPPGFRERGPLPVVLAFHGGGGNATGFKRYAGLDAVADRAGFVVVYPDGSGRLGRRLLTWNAGGCCGYAREHQVDDVGFILAALHDLVRDLPLDATRVYATGHSNGAMMSYRLAVEAADRIAAIAPVAGMMAVSRFAPARPVPVLHVHSVDDPRAPWVGGLGPPFPLTGVRVMHEAVEAGLARWVASNGCPPEPRVAERRRRAPDGGADHTATRLVHGPCASGAEVALWRLTGAGHGWPGGPSGLGEWLIGPETDVISAAEEAWAFLARFSRPEAPPLGSVPARRRAGPASGPARPGGRRPSLPPRVDPSGSAERHPRGSGISPGQRTPVPPSPQYPQGFFARYC